MEISFLNKHYGTHYRALWRLGLPIMIGQLGVIVMGFADTLMVGHHSTNELAAASFVNNVFALCIVLSLGFAYGLTPLVGHAFGQNNTSRIASLLKNSLVANSVFAFILLSAMMLFYLYINRMGQPEELLQHIKPYFLIQMASLPFVLWFNSFKQFSEGITNTKTPMWILVVGNVINIVLNYLLIYGKFGFPELGLNGAGWATCVARVSCFILFLFLFFGGNQYDVYHKAFHRSRITFEQFMALNRLGWPLSMQMGVETAAFCLSAIMVGWLGTLELATHQIALTISQCCFLLYYGMGSAIAIRVSYFHGQNDNRQAVTTSIAGTQLILLLAVVTSLPIFLLRNQLGGWFTDNATVSSMVSGLVIIMMVYQVSDAIQIGLSNTLRGFSDVKWNMLIAFMAYLVVSLPLGYVLAIKCGGGIDGIWWAFPVSLSLAGIGYFLRLRYILRNERG